jgi:hypothetical protein
MGLDGVTQTSRAGPRLRPTGCGGLDPKGRAFAYEVQRVLEAMAKVPWGTVDVPTVPFVVLVTIRVDDGGTGVIEIEVEPEREAEPEREVEVVVEMTGASDPPKGSRSSPVRSPHDERRATRPAPTANANE